MISLIVTTQGDRNDLLKRLILSLADQTNKNYELILIDQSDSDSVENTVKGVLRNYTLFKTNGHISLSKARNIGLGLAKGEYVCFPDDDCWYPNDLIENILNLFNTFSSLDCICCCAYDPIKQRTLLKRAAKNNKVAIQPYNVFKYSISIGIFTKYFRDISFDENLGVGTKYGSGEETDYLLQMIKKRRKIKYFKDIVVYHSYNLYNSGDGLKKSYNYGVGYGFTIKKALICSQYSILADLFITVFRTTAAFFVFLLSQNGNWKIYFYRLNGIFSGLFSRIQN